MVASCKLSLKIVSTLPKKGLNASRLGVKSAISRHALTGRLLPPALGGYPLGTERPRSPPTLIPAPDSRPPRLKGFRLRDSCSCLFNSLKKSLLSTYYVPGPILSAGVAGVSETTGHRPHRAYVLVVMTDPRNAKE